MTLSQNRPVTVVQPYPRPSRKLQQDPARQARDRLDLSKQPETAKLLRQEGLKTVILLWVAHPPSAQNR